MCIVGPDANTPPPPKEEPLMRTCVVLALMLMVMFVVGCEHGTPTAPEVPRGAVLVGAQQASALTLIEVTAGGTGTSNNYVGQSVTIPGHASYNRIRFNWYTYGTNPAPTAFGTLYLLDTEFLGKPIDLGTSTTGFIAASEAVIDGRYVFDSKVKIKGGNKYWFYTDTQGAFAMSFYGSTYSGGDMYITGMPALLFRTALGSGPGVYVDANFNLQVRVTD